MRTSPLPHTCPFVPARRSSPTPWQASAEALGRLKRILPPEARAAADAPSTVAPSIVSPSTVFPSTLSPGASSADLSTDLSIGGARCADSPARCTPVRAPSCSAAEEPIAWRGTSDKASTSLPSTPPPLQPRLAHLDAAPATHGASTSDTRATAEAQDAPEADGAGCEGSSDELLHLDSEIKAARRKIESEREALRARRLSRSSSLRPAPSTGDPSDDERGLSTSPPRAPPAGGGAGGGAEGGAPAETEVCDVSRAYFGLERRGSANGSAASSSSSCAVDENVNRNPLSNPLSDRNPLGRLSERNDLDDSRAKRLSPAVYVPALVAEYDEAIRRLSLSPQSADEKMGLKNR